LDTYRPVVVPFGFFINNTVPLDNLTRLQAVMLFSGKVKYWNQFDATLPGTAKAVICLRHAGSGTHATLDAAVMRGDWALVTNADPTGIIGPRVYFNDGSSDEMACINGQSYSVGYADADQAHGTGTDYPDVNRMKYMGVYPSRDAIKNGVYDFWSAQWIYEDPQEPSYALTHPVVEDLMAYASDAANLPDTKDEWWASQAEMKVEKANDFAYPKFK
jgi:ABC-type phosphate transport system substrate-binding protein